MAIQFISTQVGRAKLNSSGTGNVQAATIGISTQYVAYDETAISIQNQLKTLPISGENITNELTHIAFLDTSNDVYAAKTIGIYLSDGTLFAIASSQTPIFEKAAQTEQHYAIDWILVDLSSSQITFPNTQMALPPASFTARGVIEKADLVEALAGIDDDKAITPKYLKSYIDKRIQDGINAALLGGQPPSYYTAIQDRLGYIPANINQLVGMWTAYNDGPNSGLSADRLWDLTPDDLAKMADFANLKSENGYARIAGGIIIQWCVGQNMQAETNQYVPFPMQFPNACLGISVTTAISQANNSDPFYQVLGAPTAAGVTLRRQAPSGNDASPSKPYIIAIGH